MSEHNMNKKPDVKTGAFALPECPTCGCRDVRYHKRDDAFFCRRCGCEWKKSNPPEKESMCNSLVAPEGYFVVKGYTVPARTVPAHIRPIPKKKVISNA